MSIELDENKLYQLIKKAMADVLDERLPKTAYGEGVVKLDKLKALFKETQSLPQAQAITEEEIAAEIAAYRQEK